MNKNIVLTEKKPKDDSFFDLANKAIESLSQRSREIIKKRFGLFDDEAKTLDSIGKEYKITRERVRQIIADSFRKISKSEKAKIEFERAQNKIILEINTRSGIIKQSEALFNLSGGDIKEKNAIIFFIGCLRRIKATEVKDLIEKAWLLTEDILEKIKEIDKAAKQVLGERKAPVAKKDLIERISNKISGASIKEIEDFLEVLLSVSQNKFGKWGLSFWAEINPKSAKDKIYLILKEFKKTAPFFGDSKKNR